MSFERRKVRIGRVVSDRMDKSVVVVVEWRQRHRLYGKSVKKRTRFMVHDAENDCRIGDLVRIIEARPLSKTKRWRVTQVLARQEIAEIQPEDIVVDEDVLVAVPEPPPKAVEPDGLVPDEEPPVAEEEPIATDEEPEAPAAEEEPIAADEEPEAPAAEEEPIATDEKPEAPVAEEEPIATDEEPEAPAAEEEPIATDDAVASEDEEDKREG